MPTFGNRVREVSTTTGTGTLTLGGAVEKHQTFVAGIGDTVTTYYFILHRTADEWEVGIGTVGAAPDTLSRDTVLGGTNGAFAVNLSAGDKDVYVSPPASVLQSLIDDLGGTRDPTTHALGGAEHSASTLAALNAKVSDATLDDSGDTRTPSAHGLGGAEHSTATLAQLNAKVSDATLDDSGAARTPTVHGLGGAEHSASTLAALNAKVSDATLDDSGAARPPASHDNTAHSTNYTPESRTLTAGNGLTGGGNLSANRSFAISEPSAGTAETGTASNSVMTPRRASDHHEYRVRVSTSAPSGSYPDRSLWCQV